MKQKSSNSSYLYDRNFMIGRDMNNYVREHLCQPSVDMIVLNDKLLHNYTMGQKSGSHLFRHAAESEVR